VLTSLEKRWHLLKDLLKKYLPA